MSECVVEVITKWVWCLHLKITENVKETVIAGNLRFEFVCNIIGMI